MKPDNYEFTPEEEVDISQVAQRMQWVGTALAVFGFITLLKPVITTLTVKYQYGGDLTSSMYEDLAYGIVQGAMLAVMGLITLRVSKSFKLVATTEGSDIHNMMNAVRELSKLQLVEFILVMLGMLTFLFYWGPYLFNLYFA